MTVGKRICSRRKQLGYSAEYLAEKLNCSPTTMYRYENGYIEKIPISVVAAIADILDTTPAYLMDWDEEGENEQPTNGELSEVKRSLIQFAQSLTDEQAALALRVLRSIVEGDEKFSPCLPLSDFLCRGDKMSLGQNIRIYRERLGLSQSELAEKLGYKDRSTIAKIEGGNSDLTQSKIAAIAKVLGVSPVVLMGLEDVKSEQPAGGELSEGLSEGLSEAARELLAYVDGCSEEELRQVADYVAFIKSRRKE